MDINSLSVDELCALYDTADDEIKLQIAEIAKNKLIAEANKNRENTDLDTTEQYTKDDNQVQTSTEMEECPNQQCSI